MSPWAVAAEVDQREGCDGTYPRALTVLFSRRGFAHLQLNVTGMTDAEARPKPFP
jgi:hypothetical protein